MNESEALSGLVGHIYDAAIDPGFWPDALRETARFVGGCSAAIYTKDPTSRSGGVLYDDGGLSLHYRALYFERYVQLDPATTRHFFTEIGELVATADIMPHAEFEQSRFFREWVRPQQLVDFVSTVLDRSGTSASMFGVFRHERDGIVDEATRHRMHLVVPHIRRAALIGRALEQHSARAEVLASSLDTIRAGMFLIGCNGALVHANAAGHGLLAPGGPLRVAAGRLVAADPALEQCLRDAAAYGDAGDALLGERGIALPLAGPDGEALVAHVLPLSSGFRRQVRTSTAAVAALFVQRAELHVETAPEALIRAYGLTPAELRVLIAIVEIGGAPEVAEALGISETTVKFHLRRLYEKTGGRRHADLVKLVAGFASLASA